MILTLVLLTNINQNINQEDEALIDYPIFKFSYMAKNNKK